MASKHLAKPKIGSGEISPWREQMQEMAEAAQRLLRAQRHGDGSRLAALECCGPVAYVEIALECFGSGRLTAGSDWPVCTLACGYGRWWRTLRELVSALTPSEKQNLLRGSAARVYRLEMVGP